MEHLNEPKLQAYVKENLAEDDRVQVEDHLTECDTCLEMYFNVVDQWTFETPSLSDDFTDQTIDQIFAKQVMPISEKSSTPSEKSKLMHYAIAAGLTILLMFTGVFQQMMQAFDEDSLRERPSISNQLVERTGDLLDKGLRLKGEDTDE